MSGFISQIKVKINSLVISAVKRVAPWLSDECYTRLMYRLKLGRSLNLGHPTSFFEKIQWLKLYDHRPEYTVMADKYAVKKWVADRIGERYAIPTLGLWNRVEEIDFDALPERFVLKTTHDNGGVVICRDKSSFDRKAAVNKLKIHMKRDFYAFTKEWPYKDIPHRIMAEPYMEDGSGGLIDYKVYCLGGTPVFMHVVHGRYKDMHVNFYDMDWRLMPFSFGGYPTYDSQLKRPSGLAEMNRVSVELSRGIPFVRIDFYEVDGAVFLGEMTFFPAAGFTKYTPEEYDAVYAPMIPIEKTRKA